MSCKTFGWYCVYLQQKYSINQNRVCPFNLGIHCVLRFLVTQYEWRMWFSNQKIKDFMIQPKVTRQSFVLLVCESCFLSLVFFSSPEHEVLMVSYCGQWLSVVHRRPSCVNIWCLHSRDHICDPIFIKLCQNVCFNNI